jgi:aminoglycoside phosphotransferase (APT) family kinase protein
MLMKPGAKQIREALAVHAVALSHQPIAFLAEGWSFWAFTAGDHVLRFPKFPGLEKELKLLDALMPELATTLSARVPVPDFYVEDGPNGAPFAAYPMLPGESLIGAAALLPASKRAGMPQFRLAPDFGRALGVFLRELHAFPKERAAVLGVPSRAGAEWGTTRGEFYEEVILRAFPLISCEARSYAEQRFEAYLNDASNFEFEPRLIHGDLDRQNVLVDLTTGELSGVIDFGDVAIGDPAIDLWLPLMDFERLGIGDQLPDFLAAYSAPELDLNRARRVVDFIEFTWPFHDILYGLRIGDDDFVAGGIQALNRTLPADLRCT